jgi:hypothetical protein
VLVVHLPVPLTSGLRASVDCKPIQLPETPGDSQPLGFNQPTSRSSNPRFIPDSDYHQVECQRQWGFTGTKNPRSVWVCSDDLRQSLCRFLPSTLPHHHAALLHVVAIIPLTNKTSHVTSSSSSPPSFSGLPRCLPGAPRIFQR